ncbi:flavin-containing monooxygenase [Phytohalomonas tamaricis]|uniref:flavin-containing monooxygenase n=1 Tax=Phytohalomonas tamaricis TaxID=2081032 RepID=UPI000D0AD853|nr:NAD(P)/FAD-dependent oxidoreductase [Phytohalomonas tamaricis]
MSKAHKSFEHEGDIDIAIIGAGIAGMYMLYRARELGLKAQVYEQGDEVGGTWYRNRYPGLRCDVESMDYSYSFSEELQQEWKWSERFSTQGEILRYLKYVAEKFDLRRDINFNTRIVSAHYNDENGLWRIKKENGETVTSLYYVMATGCLSVPKEPNINGIDDFKGNIYYTTDWPKEPVDFSGKRVAVIGNGSSGIQVIPILAEQAQHLMVFQRTPSFSLPAYNGPIDPDYAQVLKDNYTEHRRFAREDSIGGIPFVSYDKSAFDVSPAERWRVYNELYQRGAPFAFQSAFNDLLTSEDANHTAADFIADKIRRKVNDPDVAEMLIPHGQYVATRRLCMDTGYYETFNRDNVTLTSLKHTPIERIVPEGIQTLDQLHEFDCIVFATGYDAVTGALLRVDIRGKEGLSLAEKWEDGPRSNMGIMVADFPNMFTITGPGSPSVLSNMFVSIENHVDWIANCIKYLGEHGNTHIASSKEGEADWVAHANEVVSNTLFPKTNSWYMGANVPGKPRVFLAYIGGVNNYRKICDQVANSGYPGFVIH